MRPYMLWLARVYANRPFGAFGGGIDRDTALTDWIKYQSEQRFLVAMEGR